jgi:hypothetical protein
VTIRLPIRVKGVDVDDVETWPDVTLCDSKDAAHLAEPRFATWRCHWISGPVDYCEPCKIAMTRVAAALGAHLHCDEIPLPVLDDAVRGIALGGVRG